MALVTLCPGCGTTYKIYPEQLQAQNGQVRCGNCRVVFNGFATLITIDETEIKYLSIPAEKNIISDESDKTRESGEASDSFYHEPVTETDGDPAFRVEHVQGETPRSTRSIEFTQHAESVTSAVSPEESPELGVPENDFLSDEKVQRPPQHSIWKFGNIALLILLMGQAVYMFRADLAFRVPQSRPYLEHACKFLGCAVPLPENIRLLSIVSSNMEVRDPEYQPGVATLTVIIRNHANYTQALPALKLLLTDIHNQLLASRIFTATEYLSKEHKRKRTIEPNQEIIIQLYLDNDQLKSTGYQLQLLY